MKLFRAARAPVLTCLLAAGCSEPGEKGQIMLVVQTDMSLPKDIDAIRIQIRADGAPRFDDTFDRIGDEDSIRLPGSLGILAGEDPSTVVSMRVTAYQGGYDGKPRVLRETITTIPEDRLVMLRMPLSWLCVDRLDDRGPGADPGADCAGANESCVAGECVPSKVDANTLPPYEESEVFGGGDAQGNGLCFDVGHCFVGGSFAAIDTSDGCTIEAPDDGNVAILTEGDGICGPGGCFVALDANADHGWQPAGAGRLRLPAAACDRVADGTALGVIVAPSSGACPMKSEAIPTCGPWSAVGGSPPEPGTVEPVALASGQRRPVGLSVSESFVFWTTAGIFGEASGALKRSPLLGGAPRVLASGLAGPSDVARDVDTLFWTEAGIAADDGRIASLAGAQATSPTAEPQLLASGLSIPEGLAVGAERLFFTTFGDGGVASVPKSGPGPFQPELVATPGTQSNPYRIALDATHAYWTNEGTGEADPSDAAVMRIALGAPEAVPEVLAAGIPTPRGLALELGEGGAARSVYFTSFAADGAVYRVDVAGAQQSAPVAIATGQSFPNGITVDGTAVIWTNRGDGRVLRLPTTASGIEEPEVLAGGQIAPGKVVVAGEFVYWLNEGSSTLPNGGVMKLKKK